MPTPNEFQSVILTVDHTTEIPTHTVQKMVFSTETVEETALALLKYYSEEHLLASAATIGQFQQLAKVQFPALIYRTRENVQIILGLETFLALEQRSETMLDCTQFILNTVGQVVTEVEKAAQAVVPLHVFGWELAAEDATSDTHGEVFPTDPSTQA